MLKYEYGGIMNYQFSNRISKIKVNPLRANARKNMEHPDVISFAYGFPPEAAFPSHKLAEISQKLYDLDNHETFLQYGPSEGHPEFLSVLGQRLSAVVNAYDSEADELMVVSGSTQGMDLTIKAFCNEGDVVICESQTFSGAVNSIRAYGAEPLAIPMKGESIDLDLVEAALVADVEKKIKLIYLIPTFQNPLGTSMPLEDRKRVYELAKAYGVMIFEDDPYGDLLYVGEHIPKIKSFDKAGIVIYSGSFSKILAPSSRVGFLVIPKGAYEMILLGKQTSDSHTNQYWQLVAAKFMIDYDFEAHIDGLRELYKEKYLLMMDELDKISPDLMTYIKPAGGYFLCGKLSSTVDIAKFYDYLIEHQVAIIPGNVMSVAQEGFDNYFRLNFTKPTLDEIRKGINIINEALQSANLSTSVKELEKEVM